MSIKDRPNPLDFLSCCPGDHSFKSGCLGKGFTDQIGLKREVISVDGDDLVIVSTFPNGNVSGPWVTSRSGWIGLWTYHVATPLREEAMSIKETMHYVTCNCLSSEHTLRFSYDDEEQEVFTSIFLNDYRTFPQKVWVAIKYVFGYKSRYGQWDCTLMDRTETEKLRDYLTEALENMDKQNEN